ncbi:DNA cross-link repair protein PSO2/SNM1 [Exophiala xenobiotica]|nr:DNA cross-link repair protein PSO2/SNM1 [Exophiala xenobiotica]KAK5238161.1 DNA cross-link repair protein PSO2/SNM1 [Exophiala xenobiotica]KAK5248212.1 DNA cross-link repair protein PSO2/SNM1 [Exophiala xenobiotica]KAK5355913.1 DNA cross-link repair protein PSO2/SNM1 [Exophiala xenobiotica]KAK5385192.1 DNA cross-link repair protein PSO2/SNM1 [Exophiala xenobiotica]
MFRNPRGNATVNPSEALLPSTGRPPTPPATGSSKQLTSSPYFASTTTKASSMSKTPILGRQPATKIPSSKKGAFRQNQSILQFFGKADKNDQNGIEKDSVPLFFKDAHQSVEKPAALDWVPNGTGHNEQGRYNEDETPVKRRRTSQDGDFIVRTPSPECASSLSEVEAKVQVQNNVKAEKSKKQRGGFLDDSSDEEEEGWAATVDEVAGQSRLPDKPGESGVDATDDIDTETGFNTTRVPLKPPDFSLGENADHDRHKRTGTVQTVPELAHEETSMFNPGDFGEEEFVDDEFYEGGEEFMERRWMEEQREMGLDFDEDSKSESGADSVWTPRSNVEDDMQLDVEQDNGVSRCPLCSGSMEGLSENQASSHVNACLDGTAESLPKERELKAPQKPKPNVVMAPEGSGLKRFQRAAIPRPAQSNPFSVGSESKGGSAFTRLMSGHAEDAAWAEAAANEVQSRGKPAYQRTCPFYKIMPGFYICVDAFRYGKVEGQHAYFLSHFHSDHYIGLTSSWCHGPIYASKVTCNLMLQQLKVDPKWVVPLEFEKKVEVPNTNGAFVTMIPANHCPGSSLYLFEKATAHVSHPLLRPDVMCSITGQVKQQVIDTCYLDTTYLTPKYAFPSQHDVIDACAQMCVSLSKEIVDVHDNWERTKADRAGSTMKKFLEQGESSLPKQEDDEELDKKPKKRGRLLVVIGTYSIGKERICLGIAKALNSKIYAPPSKMRICKCLEDDELNALLTPHPLEAQVHMQTLMEIRAETLHEYMTSYGSHFARVVGFRPTGWSYRPPTSRFTENPAVNTVLTSEAWKSRFTMRDLAPQRGSTRESNCFGVPYSEHSSFRELTMFCCALRINRIVPTVNVGSARSREKMKSWIEKWDAEKRKNGLFQVEVGAEGWGSGDGKLRYGV